jgi:hypothetical protein
MWWRLNENKQATDSFLSCTEKSTILRVPDYLKAQFTMLFILMGTQGKQTT